MRIGLQARYTIAFLGVIGVVVIALATSLLFEFGTSTRTLANASAVAMERDLQKQLLRRGSGMATFLAESLFNPLYRFDMEAMESLLSSFLTQQDVVSVRIFDAEMRLVHDGSGVIQDFGKLNESDILKVAVDHGGQTIAMNTDRISIASPIATGDKRIGAVYLELSKDGLAQDVAAAQAGLANITDQAMRRTGQSVVTLTLALFGLGLLVAYFMSRSLTLPIRQFSRVAAQIGRGVYASDVTMHRNDEIGDLAVAFNEMSNNLSRSTQEMRHAAYHDSLTGLPNRMMFEELVHHAVHASKRRGHKVALMFLDLDNFKRINDSLGHAAGDLLLSEAAQRLVQCVRAEDVIATADNTDQENEVARLGGDEFTILLPHIDDPLGAAIVASRLLNALREPFRIANRDVVVSGSIGITIFPDDAQAPEELLKNADIALYHAKEQGRNGYAYFVESMTVNALHKLDVEQQLREAVKRDEFETLYQPLVDASGHSTVGAEALVRWHHPARGLVMPGEFIPVAEETGLIVDIGNWVLRRACTDAAAWHAAGHETVGVSVNVSAMQLRRDDFPDLVQQVIAETGVPPGVIRIELTETALMQDEADAQETLQQLKQLGVRVWLDDFGTGYSSLSYLRRFPIDGVKIDRSFIRDIEIDEDDLALTSAIIAMADSLNLEVVAEGVETERQAQLLRARECATFQGFLYGRPMRCDALVKRFSNTSTTHSSNTERRYA